MKITDALRRLTFLGWALFITYGVCGLNGLSIQPATFHEFLGRVMIFFICVITVTCPFSLYGAFRRGFEGRSWGMPDPQGRDARVE
jgi:hypothetical protein